MGWRACWGCAPGQGVGKPEEMRGAHAQLVSHDKPGGTDMERRGVWACLPSTIAPVGLQDALRVGGVESLRNIEKMDSSSKSTDTHLEITRTRLSAQPARLHAHSERK